jgi:broad specificity phosphatase PhoE
MYLMQAPNRNTIPWEALAKAGAIPVLLIRHGQTSWNKERRFLGRSNVPLDAEGERQAILLARALEHIPLAALYSSPLARAWGTAEAISAGRSTSIQAVDGLTELDQGELEGLHGSALPERYPDLMHAWAEDPTHVRLPDGETLDECRVRSVSAVHGILCSHQPGAPVAIVAHRMVIGCLLCDTLALPLRFNTMIGQRNTAINVMSFHDGSLRLHRLNDADHLGGDPPLEPMPA